MTTYYVDFSTGSDSDSGLSEDLAWKTLNKVNTKTGYASGSSILLKRDEHWHEPLRLLYATAGNVPLTVDAYGTGAEPIVSGGVHLDSGWALQGGTSYIWRHTGLGYFVGSMIYNEAATPIYQVHSDTAVTDGGNTQGQFYYDAAGDYVDMWSVGDPAGFYSSIEGLQDIEGTGGGPYGIGMDDLTVRNLHFSKWGENGWSISDCQNHTLEYCTLSLIGGADDGQAFMPWQDFSGLVCRYNTFHDVYNVAITLQASGAYTADNVKVHHNTVYDCYRALEIWQKNASPIFSNWDVCHNTFYNSGGGNFIKIGSSSRTAVLYLLNNSSSNLNIRNNIFHATTTSHWYAANTYITGVNIDYNDYYPDTGTKFYYNGNNYSFADWKANTPFDDNSITTDPLLTDAPAYDFHLQNGSPCIDTGVVISGVDQQVAGAAPDMGVYEKPIGQIVPLPTFFRVS